MYDQITNGVINEQAIRAFKYGACAGLAIALHDATGWPLIQVGYCDELPLHFMVRHPDGQLLDIQGAHTDDDVLIEYDFIADGTGAVLAEVTRAAAWACYRDDCGVPVPLDVASTFVPTVLAANRRTLNP